MDALRRCTAGHHGRQCIFHLTLLCVCMTLFVYIFVYDPKQFNTRMTFSSNGLSAQDKTTYSSTTRITQPAPILLEEENIFSKLEQEVSNLPVEYMKKSRGHKMFFKNSSCAKFPSSMSQLSFNNIYWQSFIASDRIFHFLGAYYDDRILNPNKSCVRIIAWTNQIDPSNNYCQFWFEGRAEPTITKVKEYLYIWLKQWGKGKKGSSQPYIITCQLPSEETKVPSAVSIVENQCDNATNLLKVSYEKSDIKANFAVCVKGLNYLDNDISLRLIEWIELLKILGADIIYMYKMKTHPNITKVLDFYEKTKQVRVVPLTLPGFQPNHPVLQDMFLRENVLSKRHTEVITYNDCFYRNIHKYKYVVVLDIDEVIIPLGDLRSWNELMDDVQNESQKKGKKYASFFSRHVYFMDNHMHNHDWFDGIPKHLHMLQHVYRSINFTKPREYVKSFFDTERILLLHNHLPLACFGKFCAYPISPSVGQLQHYRVGCERSVKKLRCNDFINNSTIDTAVWKFKDDLIKRTNNVIEKLEKLRG